MAYLSLFLVGVGSTLFHATLKFEMQLFDELPMMVLMATNTYLLFEVRTDNFPHEKVVN